MRPRDILTREAASCAIVLWRIKNVSGVAQGEICQSRCGWNCEPLSKRFLSLCKVAHVECKWEVKSLERLKGKFG